MRCQFFVISGNLATVAATNHSHSNGNSYSRSEVDPDTENSFQVDRTNSEPNLGKHDILLNIESLHPLETWNQTKVPPTTT